MMWITRMMFPYWHKWLNCYSWHWTPWAEAWKWTGTKSRCRPTQTVLWPLSMIADDMLAAVDTFTYLVWSIWIWCSKNELNINLHLYKLHVLPVHLHSCVTWAITEDHHQIRMRSLTVMTSGQSVVSQYGASNTDQVSFWAYCMSSGRKGSPEIPWTTMQMI